MAGGEALRPDLQGGLEALGLGAGPEAVDRLLAYLELLDRWSRVYNLTAVREPARMVSVHLLDSLAARPFVTGGAVIDVGSGAGLPGIPLAICSSGQRFVLLDSSAKKVRFLRHAVMALRLEAVQVVHERTQSYRPRHAFDTVISRAFASLSGFVAAAGHLCAPGGRLLAMKGRRALAEEESLSDPYRIVAVHRVDVPGLDAERHIYEIRAGAAIDG